MDWISECYMVHETMLPEQVLVTLTCKHAVQFYYLFLW